MNYRIARPQMDKGKYGSPIAAIADCRIESIRNPQSTIRNQYPPLCICAPAGKRLFGSAGARSRAKDLVSRVQNKSGTAVPCPCWSQI